MSQNEPKTKTKDHQVGKGSRKKKTGRKKKLHPQGSFTGTFAGGMLGVSASVRSEGEDIDAIYKKEDAALFTVDRDDVPLRQSETYPSYEVYWKMPGYTDMPQHRGSPDTSLTVGSNLRSVDSTNFTVENVSDNTMWFRFQRAHGYVGDPSSVASWEPITKVGLRELKPRETWNFTITYTTTNIVCPRVVNVGGGPHVHVVSYLCFREPQTDSGARVVVDPAQTGFTISMKHYYTAASSDVGTKDVFRVLTFSGSKHLDHIDPPPAQKVNAYSLYTAKGPPSGVAFNKDTSKDGKSTTITLACYQSKAPYGDLMVGSMDYDFLGLDRETIYKLGTCPAICGEINGKWVDLQEAWVAWVSETGARVGMFNPGNDYALGKWNLIYPGYYTGNAEKGPYWRPVANRTNDVFRNQDTGGYMWACSANIEFTPAGRLANCYTGTLKAALCCSNAGASHHPAVHSPRMPVLASSSRKLTRPQLKLPCRRELLAATWWETTLSAVRIILKVFKTAITVAATFGLVAAGQRLVAPPRPTGRVRAKGLDEFEHLSLDGN